MTDHTIPDHDTIIGPERRERLIQAAADRIHLEGGMQPDAARRYAETAYANADPVLLIGVGQVWRLRPGRKKRERPFGLGPGDDLTIAGVDRDEGMVDCGGGLYVNYAVGLRGYYLAEWPADFRADEGQAPQAPRSAVVEAAVGDSGEDEREEPFDPREMYVIVGPSYERMKERRDRGERVNLGEEHLPMLGEHYTTHLGKSGKVPFVFLDLVSYVQAHLAEYLDGWQAWLDMHWNGGRGTFGVGTLQFFNEIGGDNPETELRVAAYFGHWLHDRIMADVVAEHGKTSADYQVTYCWAPGMIDPIIEMVPEADPTRPLRHDHHLAQVRGQQQLPIGVAGS